MYIPVCTVVPVNCITPCITPRNNVTLQLLHMGPLIKGWDRYSVPGTYIGVSSCARTPVQVGVEQPLQSRRAFTCLACLTT